MSHPPPSERDFVINIIPLDDLVHVPSGANQDLADQVEAVDGADPDRVVEQISESTSTITPQDVRTEAEQATSRDPPAGNDGDYAPPEHSLVWKLLKFILPNVFFRLSEEEQKRIDERQGYNMFIREKVEDFDAGYPQLSAYMNSDDTFLIYRKFGRISNRILEHQMVELDDLEQKLDELDRKDAKDEMLEFRLRGHYGYDGWNPDQKNLLLEIRELWRIYADILLKTAQISALGRAPARNHMSVYNWVWENNALGRNKMRCFRNVDDFVSLAKHAEKDRWAKNFIEGYLDTRPNSILRLFLQTQREKDKTSNEMVDHYEEDRLTFLQNLLIACLGAVGLLTPVFVLFLVRMSRMWMCITGGVSVILSTTLLANITGARPHEMLFGMAAYSAVIFIFLGNVDNQSN